MPQTGTGFGDWLGDIDSSAPLLSDQIYGDHVAAEPSPSSGEEVGDEHLRWARDRVWYRRPDERWLRPFVFLFALAAGMVVSPKVELYLSLVCEDLGIASPMDPSLLLGPSQRPPVSMQCQQSTAAQADQISLQLKLTLAMGILSAITTGFWGGLSDRRGRIPVFRLAVLGLTINDVVFIAAGYLPQSSMPFGKNFLVVGSALEGCLGGFATLTACHQAYISDVTPNGTRAKIFSLFAGILFLGFAVGPSLGGWMSKYTNSLMSPFYFALGAHILYLLFTLVGLPESLGPEKKARAIEEYDKWWQEVNEAARTQSIRKTVLHALLVPLQPLALFLPHRRHDEKQESTAQTAASSHISVSQTQARKLDWNMTLLTLALFLESACAGIISPKISYAKFMFGWSIEDVGYYISFASTCRVVCLVLIIPVIIKWTHKPPQAIALPQDGIDSSEEQLNGQLQLDEQGRVRERGQDNGSMGEATSGPTPAALPASRAAPLSSSQELEKLWTLRSHHLRQIHDSTFDKRLALVSICINALCFLALAFSRNMGPIPFLLITALSSLGGAAAAAISSLALALLEKDSDAGKFFAACAVLTAISATVLGPVVFMELYRRTVSWAPESIFVLAFGACRAGGVALRAVC